MIWPRYFIRHSLLACCRQGYWFCTGCHKVAGVGPVDTTCKQCKTYHLKWMPPTL